MTEIDTSKPSIARLYDFFLGGKDNYAVDRELAEQILVVNPDGPVLARDNRGFLVRAVRYLCAQRGITQFLDCGSGLPAAENTHQVLHKINPEARVLYVDNDPIVLAHGAAMLTSTTSRIVYGDIREPDELLNQPEVREFFDWSQPIGLLHFGILHHIPGDGVFSIMDTYLNAMPPGSLVAISHFFNPHDGTEVAERAAACEALMLGGDLGAGEFRTREQIEQLFRGWPLIEPGLTFLTEWWPDGPPPRPLDPGRQVMLAGVAESPLPATTPEHDD